MQVAQGNDSDSFACSCGSILGAYFADGLPEHWYAQFNNTIHTTMGNFHETDLHAAAVQARSAAGSTACLSARPVHLRPIGGLPLPCPLCRGVGIKGFFIRSGGIFCKARSGGGTCAKLHDFILFLHRFGLFIIVYLLY